MSPDYPSGIPPDEIRSYRSQLTPGEDVIDTDTWSGSVPQVNGIAPRVRYTISAAGGQCQHPEQPIAVLGP